MLDNYLILHLLLISILVYVVSANFDIKVSCCRLKCSSECKTNTEDPAQMEKPVTGFYWRDYSGTIPSDAIPVNKEGSPKTFIGLVYDPESNGTFTVTLVDGLDYVYTGHNGVVHKFTKGIQVLCSQEQDKIIWINLSTDKRPENIQNVKGGYFQEGYRITQAFVARVSDCGVNYAGSVSTATSPMDYVLVDGTYKNASSFQVIYYQKSKPVNNTDTKMEKKETQSPLISHHYEYSTRPNSIIPSFYKSLRIGSCSLVCTNRKEESKGSDPSMDYFWTPSELFSKSDAFVVGNTSYGETVWVGQTWDTLLGQNVATSLDGRSILFSYDSSILDEKIDGKILSTATPGKLKWISTNSKEILTMDKGILIRGGMMPNGTEVYIGRVQDRDELLAASVRVFSDYAIAYYSYFYTDASRTFDVLAHNR